MTAAVDPRLLAGLIEWLSLPSVSAGHPNPAASDEAARWVADRISASGGAAELVRVGDGAPLVIGELMACRPGAPTVLIYGHYDVQDPGDPSEWTSPPFEPAIRDGRIYARGAADNKGNFLPLLDATLALARAGELGVNARIVVEGEEESGSRSLASWFRDGGARGVHAAIVFDSIMDDDAPALTVTLRGVVHSHLHVSTGSGPLHQGFFGGVALNALHALISAVDAVLPDTSGVLPDELTEGAAASYTQMLWMRVRRKAAYLPGCRRPTAGRRRRKARHVRCSHAARRGG